MQATAAASQRSLGHSVQRQAPSGSRPLPVSAAAAAAVRWQLARPLPGSSIASSSGGGGGGAAQGRGRLVVTAAVKVTKGRQVLCNKTLKAKEGQEGQVAELCAQVADFSRKRMANRSSGILAYEVSEDDFEKGTFHFLELYSAHKYMTDHNSSPEVKQFVGKVQQHLEGPLGMVLYEYYDGKIGPASMEGDVKGEGGLDDATGSNRFGGGASMKQTSAVVDLTQIKEKDDEEKGVWGLKGFTFELPAWAGGKKKQAEKKK